MERVSTGGPTGTLTKEAIIRDKNQALEFIEQWMGTATKGSGLTGRGMEREWNHRQPSKSDKFSLEMEKR